MGAAGVLVHMGLCIFKVLPAHIEALHQALGVVTFLPGEVLYIPAHFGLLIWPHFHVFLVMVQQVIHLGVCGCGWQKG